MKLLVAVLNLTISVSYLSVALLIVSGQLHTRQLGGNPLAVATVAIFVTCGVAHGHHGLDLLTGGKGPELSAAHAFETNHVLRLAES